MHYFIELVSFSIHLTQIFNTFTGSSFFLEYQCFHLRLFFVYRHNTFYYFLVCVGMDKYFQAFYFPLFFICLFSKKILISSLTYFLGLKVKTYRLKVIYFSTFSIIFLLLLFMRRQLEIICLWLLLGLLLCFNFS